MPDLPDHLPVRRSPAKGVQIVLDRPNRVFLTVCTDQRDRWLAQASVQQALSAIWHDSATAWLVGDYLLMPDHIHLFCAPNDDRFEIERWIAFWKHLLTRRLPGMGGFQRGGFHHRLRDDENYEQKWRYVRENPVRAGLVTNPEDWPFQGCVHDLSW